MNIDFKQPRYILPIIMFPFLCLMFYGYKSFSKESPTAPKQGLSGIQSEIGKASEHIQNKKIDSKMEASRETYKRANDGYTAIKGIELDIEESSQIKSLYNEEEKRLLDSIDNALKNSGFYSDPTNSSNTVPPVTQMTARQQSYSKEDEENCKREMRLKISKKQLKERFIEFTSQAERLRYSIPSPEKRKGSSSRLSLTRRSRMEQWEQD